MSRNFSRLSHCGVPDLWWWIKADTALRAANLWCTLPTRDKNFFIPLRRSSLPLSPMAQCGAALLFEVIFTLSFIAWEEKNKKEKETPARQQTVLKVHSSSTAIPMMSSQSHCKHCEFSASALWLAGAFRAVWPLCKNVQRLSVALTSSHRTVIFYVLRIRGADNDFCRGTYLLFIVQTFSVQTILDFWLLILIFSEAAW